MSEIESIAINVEESDPSGLRGRRKNIVKEGERGENKSKKELKDKPVQVRG